MAPQNRLNNVCSGKHKGWLIGGKMDKWNIEWDIKAGTQYSDPGGM